METKITPAHFLWCGSSAVVAHWNEAQINSEEVMVIPQTKEELPMTMTYYGPVVLSQEEDGMRIITTVRGSPTRALRVFRPCIATCCAPHAARHSPHPPAMRSA